MICKIQLHVKFIQSKLTNHFKALIQAVESLLTLLLLLAQLLHNT